MRTNSSPHSLLCKKSVNSNVVFYTTLQIYFSSTDKTDKNAS